MKSDYMFHSFFFCLFDLGKRGFRNPTDRVEPRVIAGLIITSIVKVERLVGHSCIHEELQLAAADHDFLVRFHIPSALTMNLVVWNVPLCSLDLIDAMFRKNLLPLT